MGEFEDIIKIKLKDIKSSYIIKRIFSLIDKKRKLNMIMYIKNYKRII